MPESAVEDAEHVVSVTFYFSMSVFFTIILVLFLKDSKIASRELQAIDFKRLYYACIISIVSSIFMSIIPSISSFAKLMRVDMHVDDEKTKLTHFWESLRLVAWFAFSVAEVAFLYFQLVRLRATFHNTMFEVSKVVNIFLYSIFSLAVVCALLIFVTILPEIGLNVTTLGVIYCLTLVISVLLPIIISIIYSKNLLKLLVNISESSLSATSQSGTSPPSPLPTPSTGATAFPPVPSTPVSALEVQPTSGTACRLGSVSPQLTPQVSLSPRNSDLQSFDKNVLNVKQKELLRVMTKQTVLSFVQSFCFLIYLIYTCISLLNGTLFENMYGNAEGTMMEIVCWFACMVWPTCIWLSFGFTNKKYIKLCGMLDTWCLGVFEKIAIKTIYDKMNQAPLSSETEK